MVAIQLELLTSLPDNGVTGTDGGWTPSAPSQNREKPPAMTQMDSTTRNQGEPVGPAPDSVSPPRKTYPQDWPAYNAAQTSEKDHFHQLLADLCGNVDQPDYLGGRPRFPLRDMVFVGAIKVYSGFSARRFNCDVREAHKQGYIDVAPSFNSVNRYISDPGLMPVLLDLIGRSAAPLVSVESSFAIDSSGFSTCKFERWFDAKWGKEKSQRQWLKAHIICGVKTNVVTSVKITSGNVNDSPVLPGLLDGTAVRFDVAELSADKAYLSNNNLQYIEHHGAEPFIPFKSNTTGKGSPMWRRLYAYFTLNEDEWKEHYHRRSNVETTFSMIKGKFGDALRSKSETGQVNEILLKVLCHNICVLVQEMYELGVTPSLEPTVKLEVWRN